MKIKLFQRVAFISTFWDPILKSPSNEEKWVEKLQNLQLIVIERTKGTGPVYNTAVSSNTL